MSFELLDYEPPIERPQIPGTSGARKYTGDQSGDGYRAKREGSEKWKVEQKIIEDMLDGMPMGHWVLDIPCGEGRFFDFYHKKGFCFRGVDISPDQLNAAAKRVKDPMKARLMMGNICAIPLQEKSVDATVMCRITRWLSPDECVTALKEAQRVTRDRIIVTANKGGVHPRPLSLFGDNLEPGWNLSKDVPGYINDYRILMFKRNK